MDEKILIYVIIGVIYFLFNLLRKKSSQDGQEVERQGPSSESDRPKPVSFEDLLREITEGKQSIPAPPVIVEKPQYRPSEPKPSYVDYDDEPQPTYVDYDDDIEGEEKSLEKVTFDQSRANEIYEKAKKEAFNRPSLEESLKLSDVNTSFGKFKEFEVKTERNFLSEYVKDLRDPKGFKRALVLSEVLNRKHF